MFNVEFWVVHLFNWRPSTLNPKIKELRHGERDATMYMIMFLLHSEPHFESTSQRQPHAAGQWGSAAPPDAG